MLFGEEVILKHLPERDDGRQGLPALSIGQWDKHLGRGPCDGCELAIKDFDGPAHQMSFINSTKRATKSASYLPCVVIGPNSIPDGFDTTEAFAKSLQDHHGPTSVKNLPLQEIDEDAIYVVLDCYDDSLRKAKSNQLGELLQKANKILWITSIRDASISYGSENSFPKVEGDSPNLRLITLHIQHLSDLPGAVSIIRAICRNSFDTQAMNTEETVYKYENQSIQIPRLKPHTEVKKWLGEATAKDLELGFLCQKDKHLEMNTQISGGWEKPHFIESEMDEQIYPSDIEVEVRSIAMNFEDKLPSLRLGTGECSGVVVRVGSKAMDQYQIGDRVCAWGAMAYASHCRVTGSNAYRIPFDMPFHIAASLPMTFVTAYYGLIKTSNLQRGQKLLIHASREPIADAAVQIAKAVGAKVYFLTGCETKEIVDTFGLIEEDVFSTTALPVFLKHWHRNMGEVRADVVIDLLPGDFLEEYHERIAAFGRYVKIGAFNQHKNLRPSFDISKRNIMVASVDFAALVEHRPKEVRECVSEIIALIGGGNLRPLRCVEVTDVSAIENIFKNSQNSRFDQNYVLDVTENSKVLQTSKRPRSVKLSPNSSYLLAGCMGKFGLDVCRYVANKRAKYVALLSCGISELSQQRVFQTELQRLGVNAFIAHELPSQIVENRGEIRPGWPLLKGVILFDLVDNVRCAVPIFVKLHSLSIRSLR